MTQCTIEFPKFEVAPKAPQRSLASEYPAAEYTATALENYEQLTIPYVDETAAVSDYLEELEAIEAYKLDIALVTDAIMRFREYATDGSYFSPWDTHEGKVVRQARIELGDIALAKEVITECDGDLDASALELMRRYNAVDARLSDDELACLVGCREHIVINLLENLRDPFMAGRVISARESLRNVAIFGNYGYGVRWLKLNERRASDGLEPLPWPGRKTELYYDETIDFGQLAPAHDYAWLGHLGSAKNTYDGMRGFMRWLGGSSHF